MPARLDYSREFILALRARWAKRDTYKSLARELKCSEKQLNFLLNGSMAVFRTDCEMTSEQPSSKVCEIDNDKRFYVEPLGDENGANP